MTQDQSYYQPNAASQAYADWLSRNIIEPIMPQPYTNPGTYRVFDEDAWRAAARVCSATTDVMFYGNPWDTGEIYDPAYRYVSFGERPDSRVLSISSDGASYTVAEQGKHYMVMEKQEPVAPPEELIKLIEE